MVVRLTAAAAALALLAAGCGGGKSRRDVVSEYIRNVNTIAVGLQAPSLSVSNASKQLSKQNPDRAAIERKLTRAATKIDGLRGQIAKVETPPEARRLRSLLLQLASRESELAREVAALAVFLPGYSKALSPLAAAGTKLKTALGGTTTIAQKADALDAYSATIARVLRSLRPLKPPPVSEAAYATQSEALRKVRSSTAALAQALREKRADDIPKLLRRFDEAAVSNQSLASQRARIDAVRAYNARVKSLDTIAIKLSREQARLEKTLD
jgi:hypothetical protein